MRCGIGNMLPPVTTALQMSGSSWLGDVAAALLQAQGGWSHVEESRKIRSGAEQQYVVATAVTCVAQIALPGKQSAAAVAPVGRRLGRRRGPRPHSPAGACRRHSAPRSGPSGPWRTGWPLRGAAGGAGSGSPRGLMPWQVACTGRCSNPARQFGEQWSRRASGFSFCSGSPMQVTSANWYLAPQQPDGPLSSRLKPALLCHPT